MKRIYTLVLLMFIPALVMSQPVQVQKSTFVPKEAGVFHANHTTALNTRTGQTLVVWERVTSSSRSIMGRLINARGTPASGKFTIATDPKIAHPSVAYNPDKNDFILLVDDNPQVQLARSDIFAFRLNAQGKASSDAMKISTDTVSAAMSNFFPKITYNPRTKNYAVVWLREIVNSGQANEQNNGSVAVLLNNTGAPSGNPVVIQRTVIEGNRLWGPITQDIAIHPQNGKLLVTYVQVQSGTEARKANYYFGSFDSTLAGAGPANFNKINNNAIELGSGFAWGSRIAFSSGPTGNVFFVDSFNVKRRRIDASGKLSGGAAVAFKAPKNNAKLFYPSVSFNQVDGVWRGILVAVENPFSEGGEAKLWIQQLNANGLAVGAPARIDTTAATDTAITMLVVPLPKVSTLSGYRFAGLYTLAGFKPPGQTFESSGIVKLNMTMREP